MKLLLRFIFLGALGLTLLLALSVLSFLYVPFVQEKAVKFIADRAGFELNATSIKLGLSQSSIQDLHLSGPDLEFTARSIEASYSLRSLILDRTVSVKDLSVTNFVLSISPSELPVEPEPETPPFEWVGFFRPLPVGLDITSARADGVINLPDGATASLQAAARGWFSGQVGIAEAKLLYTPTPDDPHGDLKDVEVEAVVSGRLLSSVQIESLATTGTLRINTSGQISAQPFIYAWSGEAKPRSGSEAYRIELTENFPGGAPIVDLNLTFSPRIQAFEGNFLLAAPESVQSLLSSRTGLKFEEMKVSSTFSREPQRELLLQGDLRVSVRPELSTVYPIPPAPITTDAAWDLSIINSNLTLKKLVGEVRTSDLQLLNLSLFEPVQINFENEALDLGSLNGNLLRLEIPEFELSSLNPFISGNRVTPFLDGTARLALDLTTTGQNLFITSSTPLTLSNLSVASGAAMVLDEMDVSVGLDIEVTRRELRLATSDVFVVGKSMPIASASAAFVFPIDVSPQDPRVPSGTAQLRFDFPGFSQQPIAASNLRPLAGDLIAAMEFPDLASGSFNGSVLIREVRSAASPFPLDGEIRFNTVASSRPESVSGNFTSRLNLGESLSRLDASFSLSPATLPNSGLTIRIPDSRLHLPSLETFVQSILLDPSPTETVTTATIDPENSPLAPLAGGLFQHLQTDLGLRLAEIQSQIILGPTELINFTLTARNFLQGASATLDSTVALSGFKFLRAGTSLHGKLGLQTILDPNVGGRLSGILGTLDLDIPEDLFPSPLTASYKLTNGNLRETIEVVTRFESSAPPVYSLSATIDKDSGTLETEGTLDLSPASAAPIFQKWLGDLPLVTKLTTRTASPASLNQASILVEVEGSVSQLETLVPEIPQEFRQLFFASESSLAINQSGLLELTAFQSSLREPTEQELLAIKLAQPLQFDLNSFSLPESFPENVPLLELATSNQDLNRLAPLLQSSGLQLQGSLNPSLHTIRRSGQDLLITAARPLVIELGSLSNEVTPLLNSVELVIRPEVIFSIAPVSRLNLLTGIDLRQTTNQMASLELKSDLTPLAFPGPDLPNELVLNYRSSVDLSKLRPQPAFADLLHNLDTAILAVNGQLTHGIETGATSLNAAFQGDRWSPLNARSAYRFTGDLQLENTGGRSDLETKLVIQAPDTESDLNLTASFLTVESSPRSVIPTLNLNLKGNFLDLDALSGLASIFSGNPQSVAQQTEDPASPPSNEGPIWPRLNASILTNFSELRTGTARFNDLQAKVEMGPETLQVKDTSFRFLDGSGNIYLDTVYRNQAYRLNLAADIQSLDVGRLLAGLDPTQAPQITGIFDTQIRFEGENPVLAQIAEQLVGTIEITGRNGRLRALQPTSSMRALLTGGSILGVAIAGNNRLPGVVALSAAIPLLETVRYDQIRVSVARTEDLRTVVNQLLLVGPYLYVSGEGEISSSDLSGITEAPLSLNLIPASKDPLSQHFRVLGLTSGKLNPAGYETWLSGPIEVSGTLASPSAPQFLSMLESAAANTIRRGNVRDSYQTPESSSEEEKKRPDPVGSAIRGILENL
ncbi:MAG: hypothetical protein ACFCU4_11155 [Puniceicoccaceae bacterium]